MSCMGVRPWLRVSNSFTVPSVILCRWRMLGFDLSEISARSVVTLPRGRITLVTVSRVLTKERVTSGMTSWSTTVRLATPLVNLDSSIPSIPGMRKLIPAIAQTSHHLTVSLILIWKNVNMTQKIWKIFQRKLRNCAMIRWDDKHMLNVKKWSHWRHHDTGPISLIYPSSFKKLESFCCLSSSPVCVHSNPVLLESCSTVYTCVKLQWLTYFLLVTRGHIMTQRGRSHRQKICKTKGKDKRHKRHKRGGDGGCDRQKRRSSDIWFL